MSLYLEDKTSILNRISNFSFERYTERYTNWKKKIGSTDTFFVIKTESEYIFAPVKYIMSVLEDNHDLTNGGEARKKALTLGFMVVEGNVKKEFKVWCEKNNVKFKPHIRLLAPVEAKSIQNIVKELCSVEKKLKNHFVMSGNKSLQGELGEWLVQVILEVFPLTVNFKGADLITGEGLTIEVKTKRPHFSNANGIRVGKSKVRADYIAFIWFNENFKIEYFTLVTKEQFISTLGVKESYVLKAHETFSGETISYDNPQRNVSWRSMIKNEKLLESWLA